MNDANSAANSRCNRCHSSSFTHNASSRVTRARCSGSPLTREFHFFSLESKSWSICSTVASNPGTRVSNDCHSRP